MHRIAALCLASLPGGGADGRDDCQHRGCEPLRCGEIADDDGDDGKPGNGDPVNLGRRDWQRDDIGRPDRERDDIG
jgi:hypothetical protein